MYKRMDEPTVAEWHARLEREAQERAEDICPGFRIDRVDFCKDCRTSTHVNTDPRCASCAAAFVDKMKSVAIHAEPWGLKYARKHGFATH